LNKEAVKGRNGVHAGGRKEKGIETGRASGGEVRHGGQYTRKVTNRNGGGNGLENTGGSRTGFLF